MFWKLKEVEPFQRTRDPVSKGKGVCQGRKGSPEITMSNPLPRQDELEQVTQEHKHIQIGLECLQTGRLHYLPGQPVPVLSNPQYNEVLPHIELGVLVFYFMAITPHPVARHHLEESGTIPLAHIL